MSIINYNYHTVHKISRSYSSYSWESIVFDHFPFTPHRNHTVIIAYMLKVLLYI